MDPRTAWLIAAVAIVAVLLGWYLWRRQRTDRLRQRFGPEYEREVKRTGNVARAETELSRRAARVEKLHITPLSSADAERFGAMWRRIQARFVDDPKGAVSEADKVVGEVMNARGYPLGDFEQRVADISVDHPDVVVHYRAAREIADRHARGEASTEDLRQAMVHYRALFTDMLETRVEQPATSVERERARSH